MSLQPKKKIRLVDTGADHSFFNVHKERFRFYERVSGDLDKDIVGYVFIIHSTVSFDQLQNVRANSYKELKYL